MGLAQKICCCSTLDDRYIKGFVVFLKSLLTNNPWFNYSYCIFTNGELSKKNIDLITSIYSNIFIKKIDSKAYEGCTYCTKWRTWNINCIERFDLFTLSDYDRVIFFDTDMFVKGDILDLFKEEADFGAVELLPKNAVIDHPSKTQPWLKTFNGGLLSVSKKYLNNNTKQALIDIAFSKVWSSDEPILNTFFTNEKTTFLPRKYNTLTAAITEDIFDEAKVIHFVGNNKPWNTGGLTNQFDKFIITSTNNNMLLFKVSSMYQKMLNDINNILK